jgi:hypothetical protein
VKLISEQKLLTGFKEEVKTFKMQRNENLEIIEEQTSLTSKDNTLKSFNPGNKKPKKPPTIPEKQGKQ